MNEKKDVLFEDFKIIKITDEVVAASKGQVRGNARINMGKVYTDAEKEKYIEESLKRELT